MDASRGDADAPVVPEYVRECVAQVMEIAGAGHEWFASDIVMSGYHVHLRWGQ